MQEFPLAQGMCDGGDLDCGSGLLLIIKKSMDPLQAGEVLEVRSRERTVADDLPAWCRMVKHEFLGVRVNEDDSSYFIRKGGAEDSLQDDLEAARGYRWSVRAQGGQGLTAKIHSRNHTFLAGQPADFSPSVDAPSAIDYLLAALASCLTVGFSMHASRKKVLVDDVELSLQGQLDNVLYHLQMEETGSPQLALIKGTLYVSSPAEEEELQELWALTLERSPVYQTLHQQVQVEIKFSIAL